MIIKRARQFAPVSLKTCFWIYPNRRTSDWWIQSSHLIWQLCIGCVFEIRGVWWWISLCCGKIQTQMFSDPLERFYFSLTVCPVCILLSANSLKMTNIQPLPLLHLTLSCNTFPSLCNSVNRPLLWCHNLPWHPFQVSGNHHLMTAMFTVPNSRNVFF